MRSTIATIAAELLQSAPATPKVSSVAWHQQLVWRDRCECRKHYGKPPIGNGALHEVNDGSGRWKSA